MKIAFFSNFINHHQVHVADELYNSDGVEYTFVATEPMPDSFKKAGYPDYSTRPYLLNAFESVEKKQQAFKLALEAEVVIIGSAPEEFVRKRIESGKLTFRYSERWFKSRPWYLSGPRAWVNYYKNHIRYKNKPLYMLAASAYTANDVYAIGAYKDKVFKWGYFTKVNTDVKVEAPNLGASTLESTPLMWCARFLKLKHPELPVQLAKRLKDDGYKFTLDMYGSGEEFEKIRAMIQELQLQDVVHLRGNLPNDQILQQMQQHDIFLFTSDRNEGWGAVLNEAMSNGCAVVSSNRIGSTPFLIEDGKNGLIFESENLDSFYQRVKNLLDHPDLRKSLSTQAVYTMKEVWSPRNAAMQLLKLVQALQDGNESMIPKSGPCSRTYPYHL